jgi:Domain of unknown function (DUF397)
MEVLDPRWRKSSYSGNGGNCVEVGEARRGVLVRDTRGRSGPVLRFSSAAWQRFAEQVKRSLASGYCSILQRHLADP